MNLVKPNWSRQHISQHSTRATSFAFFRSNCSQQLRVMYWFISKARVQLFAKMTNWRLLSCEPSDDLDPCDAQTKLNLAGKLDFILYPGVYHKPERVYLHYLLIYFRARKKGTQKSEIYLRHFAVLCRKPASAGDDRNGGKAGMNFGKNRIWN